MKKRKRRRPKRRPRPARKSKRPNASLKFHRLRNRTEIILNRRPEACYVLSREAQSSSISKEGSLDAQRLTSGKCRKPQMSFHRFHTTFVSTMQSKGVAQDVRMQIVGHTSADVHTIYSQASGTTYGPRSINYPRWPARNQIKCWIQVAHKPNRR